MKSFNIQHSTFHAQHSTLSIQRSMFCILMALFLLVAMPSLAQNKREFRGAWIQCVNGQYLGKSTQQIQAMLTQQLDELQKDGVNAIIFQVRAECDALYQSNLEPWSKFLTGVQGKAPSPYWDPLQWMVEQCHKRGMELHAWINPYRAKHGSTSFEQLSPLSIVRKRPDLCFNYDNLVIMNPGLQEAADYTCKVAADIVTRYDIDGFHIDDYFYPYPAPGKQIPDQQLYQQHSNGFRNIGDWRRDNVSRFVKQLGETIHHIKPWVKFGVSPFGIYRNKRNDPNGSNTLGLQNYDDLYADVLLWVNNGFIDYCVPQLYWEIGNRAADYQTLIQWWNKNAGNRPLYIGEDIERTAKYPDPVNPRSHQLPAKHRLHQQMNNVCGTVLWYAKTAADNVGNIGHTLRDYYWKYPALPPLMPFLDDKAPKSVKSLKFSWTAAGPVLTWKAPKAGKKKWGDVANRFAIYRFAKGAKVNLNDVSALQAVIYDTQYPVPYVKDQKYVYVVTALDRVGNESKGKKVQVKL